MANLVPLSKSSLIKSQKSAIIKSGKSLSSGIKSKSSIIKFSGKTSQTLESSGVLNDIFKRVIQIDKVLKDSLLLSKKENEKKRVRGEQKDFDKREGELEKKKPKSIPGIKLPSPPKMGFLDWIKNFITQTILGFFVVRLVEHLPKLLKVFPVIIKVGDFFIDVGGKLLDGLVTFIDWGYKAYDATRGFVKNIGGENIAKIFDDISSKLNTFFNLAIIAGMAVIGSGYKAAGSVATKTAGATARAGISAGAKSGVAAGARGALGTIKPLLSKLPIIGGLVEFAISWALGDPVGKAAFRGIGSALLGAIGLAIGGPIGLFIGQWAGGEGGGVLYDVLFGNKKTTSGKKFAGGGSTRRGKSPITKRTLTKKKKSRTLSFIPRKIKPGASTGGEDKVQQVFPNPEKQWWDPLGMFGDRGQQQKQPPKPKEKTANPQEFLIKSNKVLGGSNFFGPFFTLAFKSVLGQEPDELDYRNVGKGLNSWMQTTFKSGSLGFAGGGEVDVKQFFAGEDYTDIIAKSVKDSVSKEVDTTIRNLKGELSLRPVGREEMLQENIKKGTEGGFEVGPAGSSGDKLTMARNLMRDLGLTASQAAGIVGNMAAESGVENARPQGSRPGTKAPLKVDGVTGYGLVQWTSKGRQQALADFARAKGADLSKPLSMDIEYQFFLKEFKGAYGNVLSQIKKASDVKQSSTIFMQQYEIPAGYKTESKIMERYNMSKPIYDKLSIGEGKATEGRGTYISPTTSGSSGSKIAGELGRYIKSKLRQGPDFSQVHRHPEHPPYSLTSGHSRGSLHYQGRAVDIGAFTREQGPILKVISEFNRMKGVTPVQLLHGKNEPSDHSDHVHVAYEKGGRTLNGPHMAMIGEEGTEYVIDANSYAQTEKVAPGLLDILNYNVNDKTSLQKNMPAILSSLSQYTDYENPAPEVVIMKVPGEPVPIPMGGGGSTIIAGGGIDNKINADILEVM